MGSLAALCLCFFISFLVFCLCFSDNYPRSINIHRFATTKTMRQVYQMKTRHGTTAASPAGVTYPVYAAISTPSITFYQWSNDNNLYTELAHTGLIEAPDGILVFLAGESPPLDNAVTGSSINVARNLAFVKVPLSLSATNYLSAGPLQSGGFYSFGGTWTAQSVQGVTWLTNFATTATSVTRPKTARLGVNKNLVVFEVRSTTAWVKTTFMLVNDAGTVLQQTDVPGTVRLTGCDDLGITGKCFFFFFFFFVIYTHLAQPHAHASCFYSC
jgi:hypothetical protein